MLCQNYLGECWCTAMVIDPKPPTDDSEVHPLKELNIKFTVKNGKTPLILNYKTFCQTTGLEYNNGNYVANPSTKEVKAELAKIANHEALVLGGNHLSNEQLNSSQQLIVFSLLTETKSDIREIIYNYLVTTLIAISRQRSPLDTKGKHLVYSG
ncbi:hypothetical protein Tco_0999352 [Tanacetum coccineum]